MLGRPDSVSNPSGCIASNVIALNDWVISRKGAMNMKFDSNRGYFYGVLLGDGHINYTEKALADLRRGPMLMLQACDLDFMIAWRDTLKAITGYEYKISRKGVTPGKRFRRIRYILRCAQRALVDEAETLTDHKRKIPEEILRGSRNVQRAFVQGLMDSEGWINLAFGNGISTCDMTLGFASCAPWFDDFYQLVQSLGVKVSKVYKRKPVVLKSGEISSNVTRLFRMEIPSYIGAGLGFSIKRKADRLAYCSRILNDYTRNYPRYEDYYREEDIVWPAMKVAD